MKEKLRKIKNIINCWWL